MKNLRKIVNKNQENVPKGGRALRARPPLGIFVVYFLNKFLAFLLISGTNFCRIFLAVFFGRYCAGPGTGPGLKNPTRKDWKTTPKKTITLFSWFKVRNVELEKNFEHAKKNKQKKTPETSPK